MKPPPSDCNEVFGVLTRIDSEFAKMSFPIQGMKAPEERSRDRSSGIKFLSSSQITDLGSGLNFKRKKFLKLMERVAKREIQTIVIAHKDMLCRFGFDFVEWFCNLNGCEIVVLNHAYQSPQQEFLEDFMAIMHCFSAKLYFLRKYEKQIELDSSQS